MPKGSSSSTPGGRRDARRSTAVIGAGVASQTRESCVGGMNVGEGGEKGRDQLPSLKVELLRTQCTPSRREKGTACLPC